MMTAAAPRRVSAPPVAVIAARAYRYSYVLVVVRSAAVGGCMMTTAILPFTSTVVSRPSPTKTVCAFASPPRFDVGVISVQSASALPSSVTELEMVEMRVRRMFHHWKYVPSPPFGATPIVRNWSAIHIEARISSIVPASRPRIASPAIA